MRLRSTIALATFLCIRVGGPSAQTSALNSALDRYLAGEFDPAVAEVIGRGHFDELLDQIKKDGAGWVAAGAAADRGRRQLAAATFVLEVARGAAEASDWKWVQAVNLNALTARPAEAILPGILPQSYRAPNAIWWKPPPLLIEWACRLLRESAAPQPVEHTWQLAAVAVAERVGDFEFLLGSPWEARGNPQDEMEHLNHVSKRFPSEPRFALAQAVATEWRSWPSGYRRPRNRVGDITDAVRALSNLTKDAAVGAEASVRLGYLRLRTNKVDDALAMFVRADTATRDPYVVYLANYFRGIALERKRQPGDAEQAYRRALATIPRAQSATMALAALLVKAGHASEASDLVEASVTEPVVFDPWRGYEAADDRFWPELVSRLRAAILVVPTSPEVRR